MTDFYEDNFKIVEETYDVIAEEFAPLLSLENASQEEIDVVNKFLEEMLARFSRKTPKIADLGCGLGKHGRYCADFGFEVTGYDFSQKMITLADQLNDQNFARSYYNNDHLKMPIMRFLHKANICDFITDEKYDGIISCYTFIHLTRQQAELALQNLKHCLNKGALLLIIVYKGKGERIIPEAQAPGYQMFYKDYMEDELSTLVSDTGYKVLMEFPPFEETDPITAANPEMGLRALGLLAVFEGENR